MIQNPDQKPRVEEELVLIPENESVVKPERPQPTPEGIPTHQEHLETPLPVAPVEPNQHQVATPSEAPLPTAEIPQQTNQKPQEIVSDALDRDPAGIEDAKKMSDKIANLQNEK